MITSLCNLTLAQPICVWDQSERSECVHILELARDGGKSRLIVEKRRQFENVDGKTGNMAGDLFLHYTQRADPPRSRREKEKKALDWSDILITLFQYKFLIESQR